MEADRSFSLKAVSIGQRHKWVGLFPLSDVNRGRISNSSFWETVYHFFRLYNNEWVYFYHYRRVVFTHRGHTTVFTPYKRDLFIKIKQYEPIQTLYEQAVLRRAISISTDPDPLFSEYQPLPSGKRLRMPMCKTNRLKLSFVPASIKMLNSNKNNACFYLMFCLLLYVICLEQHCSTLPETNFSSGTNKVYQSINFCIIDPL